LYNLLIMGLLSDWPVLPLRPVAFDLTKITTAQDVVVSEPINLLFYVNYLH